jgi:hypothetical protein
LGLAEQQHHVVVLVGPGSWIPVCFCSHLLHDSSSSSREWPQATTQPLRGLQGHKAMCGAAAVATAARSRPHSQQCSVCRTAPQHGPVLFEAERGSAMAQ